MSSSRIWKPAATRIRQMGGPEKIEKQHQRGKLTARERLAGVLRRRRCTSRSGCTGARWASPVTARRPGGRRRVRIRQGRWSDGVRRRLRLHREGRQHRSDRRREGHAPPLDGAEGALAHRVVHRLGRRAHRPGQQPRRSDFACSPAPGTCFANRCIMSGVVPQVAAMVGPGAAGTAYIPGTRRLRADGEEYRLARARRSGAGEGRDGSGHRGAGARRLQGAHDDERRRRRRGRRRRCVHRDRAQVLVVHAVELRRRAARPPVRRPGRSP